MHPIGHSFRQFSLSSQPLNLRNTSFKATSQASYLVKKLIDKVSLGILNALDDRDNKSKVVSSTSLAPVLGMLLASMDDKARKASILGISKEELTDEMEIEIHKKLGEFSINHAYAKDPYQIQKALSCANFIGSDSAVINEHLDQILSVCYRTEKLDRPDQDRCLADIAEDFVKEKTHGKINKLFHGHCKTRRELITTVIGNVMEFEGIWERPFSKEKTASGKFICADGSMIENVKMMMSTENVQFFDNGKFGAIGKNFRSVNGEDLKLVAIITPDDSPTGINNLDSDTINHLIDGLNGRKKEMDLMLPRIKIDGSCDTNLLDKISQTFGADVIRSEDLTRLGHPSNCDLEILQKTRVSINEEGAYGQVATAATRTLRGFGTKKPPHFHFVSPGYIAIVDGQGNRLVEMLIKDGSFLEFYAAGNDSAESLKSNDLKSDKSLKPNDLTADSKMTPIENYKNYRKIDEPKKDEKIIEETINSIKYMLPDDESIDVSKLIYHKFDPKEDFNIKSAKAVKSRLAIHTGSKDNALDIRERILEWLDYKHVDFVKVWHGFDGFEVEVSNDAWDALRKKLTSTQS
ncbi:MULTISPECIES: serpin family protein [unclassified Endozoicomonas]|uniref:serpin family protein n=1 Tax=unclassified Endozoicomonas TaxID=2644528 RepID=UPI003BB548EC